MQLTLVKTFTNKLSPVLWVQKNDTQGSKVDLEIVWQVAWEKSMDCFLPLEVFCLVLMQKIELYFNKVATIAEDFVLGRVSIVCSYILLFFSEY